MSSRSEIYNSFVVQPHASESYTVHCVWSQYSSAAPQYYSVVVESMAEELSASELCLCHSARVH